MALQKQVIDITLGEGVSEGVAAKILQPPKLNQLFDARFNKRGEVEKRAGDASSTATGLTQGGTAQALWEYSQTLVANASKGPHVYEALEDQWRRTNVAGPRPCVLETDPLARGNGNYQAPSIAYSANDNLAIIAYEDFDELAIRVAFIDTLTGDLIADKRVEVSTMHERPRVVFFNSTFVLFARDTSNNDVVGVPYAPADGSYFFDPDGKQTIVTGTGVDVAYDVHVGLAETTCHLVVAKGTGGWVCREVTSTPSVANTLNSGAGRTARCIAVLHNPTASLVYVLYPDEAETPFQLSIDRFDDGYGAGTTKTKVLEPTVATNGGTRRVTMELVDLNSGTIWCATSHDRGDGDDRGGIDFELVNSAGVAQSEQGYVPNLVLITKAQRDSLGRVIVGASREVVFDITGQLDPEPLPAAWLLTADSYTVTDPGSSETQGATSTEFGLAAIARFGHDRIYQTAKSSAIHGPFMGSLELVGTELWGGYVVLAQGNPGMESFTANALKFGIDWLRADCDPKGQRVTDVEDNVLVAAGILGSFDGQRLVEANVPVLPHPIQTAGGANTTGAALPGPGTSRAATKCVGASATNYALTSSFSMGGAQYVTAFMSFRIVFRWVDAAGNLHRSTPSPIREFEFWIGEINSAGINRSALFDGNRCFLFPIPSYTSLTGEDGIRIEVEIYRTGPTYVLWDWPGAGGTDTEADRDTGDQTLVLTSVVQLGTVTDAPCAAWIEDQATDPNDQPASGAPALYVLGGELGAEPPPSALDVVSTQRRVFIIDAEDRLSIPFSKPLIEGLGPEFNATLNMRVSAEGGDLVALAPLDDKLVAFKRGRIYVAPVTVGPNANGDGTAFLPPREIATDTGCIERRSVISGPFGVAFQSDRGLYLLGRDLGLSYLGEPVEDTLDASTISSVAILPGQNEVRWTLADGNVLHWNYVKREWAIGQNLPAVAAVAWKGVHTRLQTDGTVRYDTPGTYASDGSRPLLSLTTAWLKFAGLQGFKRIWRVFLLGDWTSGTWVVDIGYDYDPSFGHTETYTQAQLAALPTPLQLRIIPNRQKCESIRFRIREATSDTPTTGKGVVLQGIRLVLGLRRGGFKHLGASAKR